MILNVNNPPPAVQWTLVLSYSDNSGIVGVWGPYTTEAEAEAAEAELRSWPIDGRWEIFACKPYTPPNARPAQTITTTCRA